MKDASTISQRGYNMIYSPTVGTKVKITSNLTEGNDFKVYANFEMLRFKGKIATVTRISGIFMYLNVDKGRWMWTADMLQPATFQTKRRTYARPT